MTSDKLTKTIVTVVLTLGLIAALSLLAVGTVIVATANNGVVTLQGLAIGFAGFVILVALMHEGNTSIN